ncbi:hypothetical protein TNCV_1033521 [Trichonephila clavipes]|nr:hypothetical protein TNCV_1033521 [Trichonephila clavipes]
MAAVDENQPTWAVVEPSTLVHMFYTGVYDNGLPSWWTGVPRPRVSFRFGAREPAPEPLIAVQHNVEVAREKSLTLQ